MDKFLLVPLHLLPELLWLQITLARPLDEDGLKDWNLRLKVLLMAHGLQGAILATRIVVMGRDKPITHSQRAAVILWATSQPEVVNVHVGAGALPCRCGRAGEVRHG